MSDHRTSQRLEFECTVVPGLRALFLIALLFSLCCIVLLPLPLLLVMPLFMLTAGLAWRCWRKRCELGAPAVTLLWDPEGRWWWLQAGEETELKLCGDSYFASGMVILNFSIPDSGRQRSMVLFPASVGPALFRRLRVRLMLEGGRSVTNGSDNLAE